jgi:transcription initiation factor TFIID subunit 5
MFSKYKDRFETEHSNDMRSLQNVRLPEHVTDSAIAKTYLSEKYRFVLSVAANAQLMSFLESRLTSGGIQILSILSENMDIKSIDRVAADLNAVEKILGRSTLDSHWPAEDEGIPGHNPGQNVGAPSSILTRLKLGPLPMEPQLFDDILAELREEDAKSSTIEGQVTLTQEFQNRIKQEETDDAPTRNDLPLPPSRARDVQAEVQKIKEIRDRFKIDAQKDKLSVCMFTFHNTQDT